MKKTIFQPILLVMMLTLLMNLFSASPVKASSVMDGFNPAPNNSVFTTAIQPDGKILVGGYFTTIGDQAVDRLARLNPDGSLDASFSTPTINSFVRFITLQPDGKILIGGEFTSVGGEEHKYIARLLPDGDVDSEFTASISTSELYAIAVQDNGKILVGGLFGQVNNVDRINLARLNSDGTLDTTFTAQTAPSGSIQALAIQPDGKILVGGSYDNLAGSGKNYFGRLYQNGAFDSTCSGNALRRTEQY